ncbi:MAG: M20/M25/M40 family metallo-hydrolase [Dehalococcoidia bacterium]|nr:M20/M25/M40 family metallo-hydrolase [Dehalococcoidia bacterium]
MAANVDWSAVTREATDLLREYLRLDTSNPPGNEERAVRFLAQILTDEGIPFDTVTSAPGRANLRASLGPPDGGVCLLNHTDVVPAEPDYWSVAPFAGELREGVVWGRGALDMKGMAVMELMVLLLLQRQGVRLRRGVRFLAAADEEAGSGYGVGWLAQHRPDWLEADLVINEGAFGLAPGAGQQPVFQVAPTEKIPLWVRLSVRGRPGHGSVPHDDNCADHLVAALQRLTAWRQKLRLTPIMEAHALAMVGAGFLRDSDPGAILRAAEGSPALRARLGNTVALTTIATGVKVNVIPAEAHATLDCRLLPDVRPEEFLRELRQVIADDRVGVDVLNAFEGAASPLEGEFLQAVRAVVSDLVEGARVVPELTTGFTDSRIYRVRGVSAYGFVPCLVKAEELAGIHGHNERISVENLRLGMQVLYEVVRRLCAA